MHADSEETFDLYLQLFRHQFKDQKVFIAYFDKLWVAKKELWSKAWRQHATFHTNNLIESYHNQLKSFNIGRSRQLRVDYLIYLLSSVVVTDYRTNSLTSMYGVKEINLTVEEEKRKKTAHLLDFDIANAMVEQLNDTIYKCKSFNNDIIIYEVKLHESNNFLINHCSCPDPAKLCKHIFLVSRVTNIPFTLRASFLFSAPSAPTTIENNSDSAALRCEE